jgi:hypothetical protein
MFPLSGNLLLATYQCNIPAAQPGLWEKYIGRVFCSAITVKSDGLNLVASELLAEFDSAAVYEYLILRSYDMESCWRRHWS